MIKHKTFESQFNLTIYDTLFTLGFKQVSNRDNHARYKKQNVEICIQVFDSEPDKFNLYVDIHKRDYRVSLNKHNIKHDDIAKTVKLLKDFIKHRGIKK